MDSPLTLFSSTIFPSQAAQPRQNRKDPRLPARVEAWGSVMLPTPAELRELSERIREAVPKALTDRVKRLLLRDALRLSEVAEQVERDNATLGAYLQREN